MRWSKKAGQGCLLITVMFLLAVGSSTADGGVSTPSSTGGIDNSDHFFTGSYGKLMHWERLAPGYGAWSLDLNSSDGTIVFSGVSDSTDDNFESVYCESVGCYVYRLTSDGKVEKLLSEFDGIHDGFGFMDVSISRSGDIAAVAINTFDQGGGSYSYPSQQGRLWLLDRNGTHKKTLRKQALSVGSNLKRKFVYSSGNGRLYSAIGFKRVKLKGSPSCAFFDLFSLGNRLYLAGWSGTYLVNRYGVVKRIGPASDAVWAANGGKTVVVDAISSSSKIMRTDDAGSHWQTQTLVDSVGEGTCENKATNPASKCNDGVAGAKLSFRAIEGSGPDDIWAVGGRQDIPGGRVYRYRGSGIWERVPFPSDIWWASDVAIEGDGSPVIASIEGIYRSSDAN